MHLVDPRQRRAVAEPLARFLGVVLSREFLMALIPRPKEKIVDGGWQGGKSTEGGFEIMLDIVTRDPAKSYKYCVIVPSYRTPHKEMDYLLTWAKKLGWRHWSNYDPEDTDATQRQDACRLSLFGGKVIVETKTAQDPEGIASESYDGVLGVESGQFSEACRVQALGRVMRLNGWITWTGTLEDAEAKPRWVWYGRLSQLWRDHPDRDHLAVSLPSWANIAAYPGGEHDPAIESLRYDLPEHTFNRRVAGIPSGVQFPIYPQLQKGDWSFEVRPTTIWRASLGAGGHDYGSLYGHTSTLVPVTVTNNDPPILVVREAWEEHTGDSKLIETVRHLLSQKFHIRPGRWGFDPLQREAADQADAIAVSGAPGSRLSRVGTVEGYLNAGTLKFDFSGKGVRRLFEQAQTVHYIRRLIAGKGEIYDYNRMDDDLVAGMEDAAEVIKYHEPVDYRPPTARPAPGNGAPRSTGTSSGRRRATKVPMKRKPVGGRT